MATVTEQLQELLAERIMVLDGSYGELRRGGNHVSPTSPLLLRPTVNISLLGLSPDGARLRPLEDCPAQ